MRLGLDGWIYLTVGYSGFEGTVGGERLSFKQSVLRFKPDGSKLEVLTSTSNNTWGMGLDETGEIVYSTANGEHSSYVGIPNRAFESVRGWLGKGNAKMADHQNMHPLAKIRQVDWFGGFTAASGHAVYTARQFPPEFWNKIAFVTEPTGHLVHMDRLERKGSGFVTRDRFNLFASTDEWTSPILAEVGPDGAVWVIDWYNYVVQHNPTPAGFKTGKGAAYETPLRDKTHGRIYRVINETRPLGKSFDLASAGPDVLLAALQSDNMFWRMRAEWKIVERGKKDVDIIEPLMKLVVASKPDEIGEAPAALHALWTLQRLGALEDDAPATTVFYLALRHRAPGVRRGAVEVWPRTLRAERRLLNTSILAGSRALQAGRFIPSADVLKDESPAVRRAALLALAEMPASEEAGAAIAAYRGNWADGNDVWISLAATSAAARHADGFLDEALAQPNTTEAFRSAVRIVAEHAARGDLGNTLSPLLARLKDRPNPRSPRRSLPAWRPAGRRARNGPRHSTSRPRPSSSP